MSVVGVLATKGGAGKSTIAVQLAIAASRKRRRPLIIDLDDPQHSAFVWSETLRRRIKLPVVREATLTTLQREIDAAQKHHDLIIIDIKAGGGNDFRRVATISDHLLVPVVSDSFFDIHATISAIQLISEQADHSLPERIRCMNALGKAAIVLNRAPAKPNAAWRGDMDLTLARCGAGALPVVGILSDSEAWRASLRNGTGIAEAKGSGKLIKEIYQLYDGLKALETERAARIKAAKVKDK